MPTMSANSRRQRSGHFMCYLNRLAAGRNQSAHCVRSLWGFTTNYLVPMPRVQGLAAASENVRLFCPLCVRELPPMCSKMSRPRQVVLV